MTVAPELCSVKNHCSAFFVGDDLLKVIRVLIIHRMALRKTMKDSHSLMRLFCVLGVQFCFLWMVLDLSNG